MFIITLGLKDNSSVIECFRFILIDIYSSAVIFNSFLILSNIVKGYTSVDVEICIIRVVFYSKGKILYRGLVVVQLEVGVGSAEVCFGIVGF